LYLRRLSAAEDVFELDFPYNKMNMSWPIVVSIKQIKQFTSRTIARDLARVSNFLISNRYDLPLTG